MSNKKIAEEQKVRFAGSLRLCMKRAHITQDDVARRLNVSSSTVSDWCNAKKYPRIGNMMELADMLDVSLSDLCDSPVHTSEKDAELDDGIFDILCKRAKKLTREDQKAVLTMINALLRADSGK